MKNFKLASWQNDRNKKHHEDAQKAREMRLLDVCCRTRAIAEEMCAGYEEENRYLLNFIVGILIASVLVLGIFGGLVVNLV